jgi:hypothetical protein
LFLLAAAAYDQDTSGWESEALPTDTESLGCEADDESSSVGDESEAEDYYSLYEEDPEVSRCTINLMMMGCAESPIPSPVPAVGMARWASTPRVDRMLEEALYQITTLPANWKYTIGEPPLFQRGTWAAVDYSVKHFPTASSHWG